MGCLRMNNEYGQADECILVCVYFGPNGERLIRRGHKMAKFFNCPLYVLTVDGKSTDTFDADKSRYIEEWDALCKELNVREFIIRDNEKLPSYKVIAEVALTYNVTQIIVGQSAQTRWEEITKGSYLNVLLKEVPFVDFHIVSVSRPIESEDGELYEKGVRAYAIADGSNQFKIGFTCPTNQSLEGIFFKEVGTDFDNGIFKFNMDRKMIELQVKEGEILEPTKIPEHYHM